MLLLIALSGCQLEDQAEKSWTHHDTGLFTAAFSHHGRYAIVAPIHGPAQFIDIANDKVIYQWQHTDQNDGIVAAAIADNLSHAITAESKSLALWRIRDGKIIGYWDFPAITDLAISPDGKKALIGLEDNKAYYFDLMKSRILYTFEHAGRVNSVALARNAPLAITGGSDHLAKVWDLRTGKMLRSWDHPFKLHSVRLSDDGSLTMTNASMNKTRIWSTASGELLHILPIRYMTVTAATFASNNQLLATGRPNYRVEVWDLKTGQLVQMWAPPKKHYWRPDSATIVDLAFEVGEKTIISEASNGLAHRWRIP